MIFCVFGWTDDERLGSGKNHSTDTQAFPSDPALPRDASVSLHFLVRAEATLGKQVPTEGDLLLLVLGSMGPAVLGPHRARALDPPRK